MLYILRQTLSSKFNVVIPVLLLICVPLSSVSARSIIEIQDEIEDQESVLDSLENEISSLENDLANNQSKLGSTNSELEQLQLEIESIQKEIEINELQLQLIQDQIALKELEKTQKELQRNISLEENYIDWRSRDVQAYRFLGKSEAIEKNREYESFLIALQQKQILSIFNDLLSLDQLVIEYNDTLEILESQNGELENKKSELEARIAQLNAAVNASYSEIGSLQDQSSNIEKQISLLQEEQKQAYQRERDILENDDGSGGGDVTQGEWYFYGSGRDLYQGHGVGLSQWGAHGMGANGFSYQEILTFYYTGTQISGGRNDTISVQGYGSMDLNAYAAGLGEVPDKACGTSEQASDNPSKYVVDSPSTQWDCWPEESIKAQVVAAKTYALWYTSVYGSICTTAVCQVYSGGTGKQWAADETQGQVVTSGGIPIEAVYSSDNSQGYGTADNDTIWQSFSGYGNPYSYLRAVNDSGYATQTQWTLWAYQTNGFTANDIDNLLSYIANSPNYSSSIRSEAQSIINQIGSVASLGFERDGSLRVKRVVVTGANGQSRTIGGWWFKNVWNSWTFDRGSNDYIYSQTFFLGE